MQTVNPTDGARLALTFTSTLTADGENSLPPAVVIGQARTDLPLLGRGSARVFSPPVTPLTIHGRQYVGVDLGRDGRAFPERRRGLMSLFGVELPLDRRLIVGFTRDISLVSAEQYARLTPPQQVQAFPADLANPDLEYAGLYEDGWVAEAAFVTLAQPATESALVVRGMIPQIADAAFTTDLRVLVDGREVAQRTLPLGEFELAVDAVSRPGRRRIDLRFSAVQQLPGADRRPAAALLRFVGFEGRPADIAQAASGLRIGGNWHALEHTPDGEAFRWAENDAEITVDGVVAAGRPLVLDVEPGPGLGGQPFLLQITDDQGRRVQSATATGRVQIEAPVAADVRALRLHVNSNNLPAPNDPRILNFRVFVVAWKGSPSLLTATALRALNEPSDIGPAADRRALATGALPPDGLFVGEGWYPFEQFGGETFRWVQNDAQIVVTAPTGARTRLRMEVEPGPGVGLAPFDLRVLDANGQTVATQPVLGRQTVEITLPVAAGPTTAFTLQAQGGGLTTPNDPRVLNFRVFAFHWVD